MCPGAKMKEAANEKSPAIHKTQSHAMHERRTCRVGGKGGGARPGPSDVKECKRVSMGARGREGGARNVQGRARFWGCFRRLTAPVGLHLIKERKRTAPAGRALKKINSSSSQISSGRKVKKNQRRLRTSCWSVCGHRSAGDAELQHVSPHD